MVRVAGVIQCWGFIRDGVVQLQLHSAPHGSSYQGPACWATQAG